MVALAKINRRGACPALAAPMQTGDGLLARLNPVSQGLSAKQLIGLCESANRNGNAIIEITSRGSVQIRGLTNDSAANLAEDINALSIDVRTGTVVATGPLAGLDTSEKADPRPLADAIRNAIAERGLSAKLAPKISVVVDGGGLWQLDQLQADIKCEALSDDLWQVEIASDETSARPIGIFDAANAAETALKILERLAELGPMARARDLPGHQPQMREKLQRVPLGKLALANGQVAVAIALPFGSIEAKTLAGFVGDVQKLGAVDFRPAPPRSLIVLLDTPNAQAVLEAASARGFVTDANDPVMRMFACPGAPACTFGHFDTRKTAHDIVSQAPSLFADKTVLLHASGCAKGCAHPSATTLTLVGDEKSVGIVVGGTARSLPLVHSGPKPLANALRRLAARLAQHRNTAEALSQLGERELSAIFRQGEE